MVDVESSETIRASTLLTSIARRAVSEQEASMASSAKADFAAAGSCSCAASVSIRGPTLREDDLANTGMGAGCLPYSCTAVPTSRLKRPQKR
eukprot:scaffold34022_cov124-Isochrysis_galbana.AAC.2